MKILVYIGIGGAIGSIFRYLLSKWVQGWVGLTFPLGTLMVNVVGSFLIGFLSMILLNKMVTFEGELRALLLIGLLGGFTTFSSFSLEVLQLWENGEGLKVASYLFLTLALCFCGTWGGLLLGRKL